MKLILTLLILTLIGCGKEEHQTIYYSLPNPKGVPIDCLGQVGPRGSICYCFDNNSVITIECK